MIQIGPDGTSEPFLKATPPPGRPLPLNKPFISADGAEVQRETLDLIKTALKMQFIKLLVSMSDDRCW